MYIAHYFSYIQFKPYTFLVPDGYYEVPVSIADLGGTELDLRFEGNNDTTSASPSTPASTTPANRNTNTSIAVIVAPQLRFTDEVRSDISLLGELDTMIAAFSPEIIGKPLDEDSVENARKVLRTNNNNGRTIYQYHIDTRSSPRHVLVSMIADGNR